MKTCTKCKTEKSAALFSRCRSKPDGRQTWCKACVSSRYVESGAARVRKNNLWHKYRLTPDEVAEMHLEQGRCCAICFEPHDCTDLHVDHCHAGEQVRGLLCPNCNIGLGQFRDRPLLLRQAAAYLERGDASRA